MKSEDRFLTCWRPITSILVKIERNSRKKFSRNYLQNRKHFLQVLLHFWNLHKVSTMFLKKIRFIAQIFSKLLSPKYIVTWMRERSCFRTPFWSQRYKWPETLLKCARQQFYHNFPLISKKLSCVSWILVRSDILGPFSKILMDYHKYSCHNWEKFPPQAQPQLS